ncbi:MAG: nucleoside-triphosphatase [Anaerolineaceae bacterium]
MGQLTSSALPQPPLFILSGPREVGKTTLIQRMLEQLHFINMTTTGVISPAVYENNIKTGIDIMDVRSGMKKRLADRRKGEIEGVLTERWKFFPEALTWGNNVLAESTPCDLMVVDELGPIELERGQGLQNGISEITRGKYLAAVVVIRPELLENALRLWPHAKLFTISKKGDPATSLLLDEVSAILRTSRE